MDNIHFEYDNSAVTGWWVLFVELREVRNTETDLTISQRGKDRGELWLVAAADDGDVSRHYF